MLNKSYVDFLRQVRNEVRNVVLNPPKAKRPHQVQKDETLEPLLEFRPENAVREFLSTFAQ